MKKISDSIRHISDMIKDKNQQIPDRLAEQMAAIRSGVELPHDVNHQTAAYTGDSETAIDSESEEKYLPASKSNHAPLPNAVLRSALFSVVGKGNRKFEKKVQKASFNGYTVKYTGEQLDQADLDVWLECLSRCQETALGYTVRFSSYEFLKSIGRDTGKSQYNWLNDSLSRMQVSGVELSDGKFSYMGSLINDIYREEETGENCLVLNPKIAVCFGDSGWTGINRLIRMQLKGKPLTQWLHGFYSSHTNPLPIKVVTLKMLCGSEVSELYKFRQMLKKSLLELATATDWTCEIDNTDKVIVVKKKGKKIDI